MAGQRRTRAEKVRAEAHRLERLSYTFEAEQVDGSGKKQVFSLEVGKKEQPAHSQLGISDLFAYDVRLIYQDILKTVVITTAILAVLIGIKVGGG